MLDDNIVYKKLIDVSMDIHRMEEEGHQLTDSEDEVWQELTILLLNIEQRIRSSVG